MADFHSNHGQNTMGGMSYKKTLLLVERFMIDSNIRKYCSEICKGKCCESCYEKNPYACYRCEGRRLTCSIYLCDSMLNLFSATDKKFLQWTSKEIKEQYRIYNKLKCIYANIYFAKPDKVFLKTVRFSNTIENVMEDLGIINIRKIMDKLIKTKKEIHQWKQIEK